MQWDVSRVLGPALPFLRDGLWALAALALVLLLALGVLRLLAKRGVGRPALGQKLHLLERLPLSSGHTLYLVRAHGRTLLLGAGEGAAPTCLAEIPEVEGRAVAAASTAGHVQPSAVDAGLRPDRAHG